MDTTDNEPLQLTLERKMHNHFEMVAGLELQKKLGLIKDFKVTGICEAEIEPVQPLKYIPIDIKLEEKTKMINKFHCCQVNNTIVWKGEWYTPLMSFTDGDNRIQVVQGQDGLMFLYNSNEGYLTMNYIPEDIIKSVVELLTYQEGKRINKLCKGKSIR